MKEVLFDGRRDLVYVRAQLWGPRKDMMLNLAVDTGAVTTLIVPPVLDRVGYSVRDGEAITSISSAIGKESGYLARVSRFSVFDEDFDDVALHVHDLPDGYNFDGLLGLDLLRRFHVEFRFDEGVLRVERVG